MGEQNGVLHELHEKITSLRTAAQRISEFALQLKIVEGDITDAMDMAKQVVSAGTGIGEIAKALAEIKAKAIHEQYEMGLAKQSIDKLVPTVEGGVGEETVWASLLAPQPPPTMQRRRNKGDLGTNFL